ncbi:MAG: hypothetical protein P4L84_26080 [Isosphaeraceae bacterium]|nr:hypothetical protein [Isosphaeraceae bacterium]
MPGSRTAKIALALLASTLAMASLVVVSSASHDEDEEAQSQGSGSAGPKPGAPVEMPPGLIGLELRLGLKDPGATEWEGEVKVSEGRVVEIDIERSRPDAVVEGARFSVGTVAAKKAAAAKNKKAAAKNKKAQAKKNEQAKKKQAAQQGATLALSLDAPASATVTVTTRRGDFTFKPSDLPARGPKTFLDDEASVERLNAALRLTPAGTEDDYPAAAKGPDGSVWLASVAYRPERSTIAGVNRDAFDTLVPTKNGDRIELRRFDGKTWRPALNVTEGGLDVWRPTVAVDGQGVVWVAWAQQLDGDWDIFTRRYTPGRAGGDGSWSDISRVTKTKGSDFHVVAATDSQGTVWLAWQAWRDGNYEILAAAQQEGHAWSKPRVVSDSPANDWGPAIAADGKGNVYVVWDTYDKGNYDVRLRALGGVDTGVTVVADSARFEGRPHLACDAQGRVWIAYEEGNEQWGKDYAHAGPVTNVGLEKNPGFALYVNRTVRVKCMADGKLQQTAGALDDAFAGNLQRNKSVPRLAVDDKGAVWLALRHHPLPGGQGETWISSYLRYDGKAWSPPRRLIDSANLIDNRPALVPYGPGVLVVYSGDRRVGTQNRREDDLYASLLVPETSDPREIGLVPTAAEPRAQLETVHPNEPADVARVRAYRIDHGGKSLRLLRGEFHRHTEFSSHNDQDGLLEDTWRYALDAGRLDWMGNGDHDNGFGHEYMWWLIQKSMDLHHNAPSFIPAVTYERSVVYPNGHRNVMMPKRGIRPLPRGELPGTAEQGAPDTKLLYDYLKHFGGICASHTSATQMGTDWRDNDPTVEPVVEIYQGHRHNYEHLGAPKSATEQTQIGGYEPAGFIWNALQKGYKLGFESSSDHVSTHISYAVVLTDDVSRQGIIDAFKQRHCYAATDNIVLDVRSGNHLMGDTFEVRGKPSLTIAALGTAPIRKVHVIRDNQYVLTTEPNEPNVKLSYTDDDAKPGESHYYYVRIEQADRNLAWASPLWVTVK